MLRDPYAPRPLAPSERECLDLAAALAAGFALHYADTCGPSGRHKPVFLETVTLRRADLAAQVEDCKRRYPPPPVVVAPPAATRPAAVVPARTASAVSNAVSPSASHPARTATPLVAAASAASWSAADDDEDSSVASHSLADDNYYSDDDDTYSSNSCGGWNPSFNTDGTPMISGTFIDFHGHVYGA